MGGMSSLRDLWQSVFPAARPVAPPSEAQLAAPVAWVRVLKARVPAFDALDPGDLTIVPASTLAVVAPGLPEVSALARELARAGVSGLVVVTSERAPGGQDGDASGVGEGLALAAAAAGVATFRYAGAEPATVERSVIGHLVNRQAELERRVGALEAALQRTALQGGGLEGLVAGIASFLGRAVVLEGRRGDALVVHAPADQPAAAAAVTAYLARRRPVALRVPLPASPGKTGPAKSGQASVSAPTATPAGTLALLGEGPPTELERAAAGRVAGLLALELARDAAVRRARDAARQAEPLPADGPPWVVLVARQPRDGVPLEQREEIRRELRLMAPPRRLALRGDAESLEVRCVAVADATDPLGHELTRRIAAFLGRTVALSRPFDEPDGRAVAEADARATLEAAERLADAPHIARADRMAVYRLLGGLHNLPDGVEQARALLAPLLVGSPAAQRERLATLRAVLEQPGLAEAAASLGVHRNTVAYRVRSIERLSGWRMAEPDLRLPLALAVRLLLSE